MAGAGSLGMSSKGKFSSDSPSQPAPGGLMPAMLPFPCGSSALPVMVSADLPGTATFGSALHSLSPMFLKRPYLHQDAFKALHILSHCHEAGLPQSDALGKSI